MYKISSDLQKQINEAETFVEENEDAIPIRDQVGHEHVHGAVIPGNKPIAFTPQLQRLLNEELLDGNIVVIMGGPDNDPTPETELKKYTVKPSDEDYIEVLKINILQPTFTIDR